MNLQLFVPLLIILAGILFDYPIKTSAKVLELSDKFFALRKEGMWLIKFYAPWCGHCKKLEPIFKHVGQSLAHDSIRVGRIDCTRFPSMTSEFGINGFPTIAFLKGDDVFFYDGDRNREDIVKFARRLMGPPVRQLSSLSELKQVVGDGVNFVFIGDTKGSLWDLFYDCAKRNQQHDSFFQVSSKLVKEFGVEIVDDQEVRVFKDGLSFKFDSETMNASDERDQRSVLDATDSGNEIEPSPVPKNPISLWVKAERFPLFMKITRGKFHHLMATGKNVAIAVLEENKIGELTPEMEEFREMLKHVVDKNKKRYRKYFVFGWTGTPDLANSVAMETLSLPNLLVVNSSSFHHHLPEDDPTRLTPEAIEIFLDEIIDGTARLYGGSSYSVRLYRSYYEVKSSIYEMWRGNPALTAVLFGLPLGFFALICYSICCADIMDAEEEDNEEEILHEKTD